MCGGMKTKILALAMLGLAACSTVDGMGKDIQAGGEAISDAANSVKEDL